MGLAFTEVTTINSPIFEKALLIYSSSFPSNERQPIEKIMHRMEMGKSQLFVALHEQQVVGMALLFHLTLPPYVLLDYLAIDPAYRSQKVGSSLFQYLAAHLTAVQKYMMIEVEDPLYGDNQEERRKRIQFYLKNGAVLLNQVPYILPSLDNTTPTAMRLMMAPHYKNEVIEGCEIKNIIEHLYEEVYEKASDDDTLQKILRKLPATISFSNTL